MWNTDRTYFHSNIQQLSNMYYQIQQIRKCDVWVQGCMVNLNYNSIYVIYLLKKEIYWSLCVVRNYLFLIYDQGKHVLCNFKQRYSLSWPYNCSCNFAFLRVFLLINGQNRDGSVSNLPIFCEWFFFWTHEFPVLLCYLLVLNSNIKRI